LLGIGAGCNTEVDTVDLDSDDEADLGEFAGMDPETTFFNRTQVTFLPDGTQEVLTEQVSLAQQIAEREAEESGITLEELYAVEHPQLAALTKPAICGSSFYARLYSATGWTGDQLCLNGTGTANLSSWSVGACIWGYSTLPVCFKPVKSFKAGDKTIGFTSAGGCSDEIAWHEASSAHSIVQQATQVTRTTAPAVCPF
jgi:hypothetical protein